LARRLGVTQQAASKTVAEMIRIGILEASTATDRRAKMICISKRGWESIRLSRRVRSQLDSRLETLLGVPEHQRIRSGLIRCLTTLGGVERIRTRRVREPQ
jgi:DNA-binding MarR family transcriptional regulator